MEAFNWVEKNHNFFYNPDMNCLTCLTLDFVSYTADLFSVVWEWTNFAPSTYCPIIRDQKHACFSKEQ